MQTLEKINGLNANVYLPEGYEKGSNYPVVIFYPGLGEAGTDASKLLVYGPSKFIKEGWKPNFIVISIQPTYGWVTEQIIQNNVLTILDKYKIDQTNVSLTGLSAGGTGIMRFGFTPNMSKYIKNIVPLSSPEIPDYLKNAPEVNKNATRFLGFSGVQDSVYVKMRSTLGLINKSEFYDRPGGHCCWNDVYSPTYKIPGTNKNIYDWMIGDNVVIPPVEPEDPCKDCGSVVCPECPEIPRPVYIMMSDGTKIIIPN